MLRDEDEGIARLLEIALQIEGLYRHASTHAAGVVIGDRPLIELVPLYRDPRSDFLVTQYSMKHVEQAGLVKFDFLGLTTLTILQRAVGLLHGLGIEVDVERLPLDDANTYEMLAKGDAGGVFQMEGQGMRDMLRQMRPDRFEDLVAAVALYRPGPMASIPEYCRRKHGENIGGAASGDPRHPGRDLRHHRLPGTGDADRPEDGAATRLGGADLLRRAMGKKIRAEMEAQRSIFTDGAIARGIDRGEGHGSLRSDGEVRRLWLQQMPCRAYGLLAYQTAWMKANHPAVFIAACMSLALGNTDRLAALREEATRSGIRILPPDINRSGADFSVEHADDGKLAIRYALAAVKKVGFAAMQALAEARGDTPFADLADFAARVDPRQLNRMQLENLIRAGAFDALETNRARLFAAAEAILRRAQATADGEGERPDRPVRRIARVPRGKRCACPTCRTGRRWSGSASRPRRSASTSPRIRSTSMPRRCAGWARRRAPRWRRALSPASRACASPAWWRRRRSG